MLGFQIEVLHNMVQPTLEMGPGCRALGHYTKAEFSSSKQNRLQLPQFVYFNNRLVIFATAK